VSKANNLTNAIIDYLNLKGYKAWRNNAIGIFDPKTKRFRKQPKNGNKNTSDILGFHKKTSRFVAIEVKIDDDKLSEGQAEFLRIVKEANGIGIEAKTFDGFLQEFKNQNG
jgi:VRR-NUC domain